MWNVSVCVAVYAYISVIETTCIRTRCYALKAIRRERERTSQRRYTRALYVLGREHIKHIRATIHYIQNSNWFLFIQMAWKARAIAWESRARERANERWAAAAAAVVLCVRRPPNRWMDGWLHALITTVRKRTRSVGRHTHGEREPLWHWHCVDEQKLDSLTAHFVFVWLLLLCCVKMNWRWACRLLAAAPHNAIGRAVVEHKFLRRVYDSSRRHLFYGNAFSAYVSASRAFCLLPALRLPACWPSWWSATQIAQGKWTMTSCGHIVLTVDYLPLELASVMRCTIQMDWLNFFVRLLLLFWFLIEWVRSSGSLGYKCSVIVIKLIIIVHEVAELIRFLK